MQLSFSLTDFGGGVRIHGDAETLNLIERLLTRTAIEAHSLDDNGAVMVLSRYFESDGREVDWVTLVIGVAMLRNALGYRLTKQQHSLVCLLEYLVEKALKERLPDSVVDIESLLESFYGISDAWYQRSKTSVESRMVYLYLLKSKNQRTDYLLRILKSLSPTLSCSVKGDIANYTDLTTLDIAYPCGEEPLYPL